MTITIKDFVPVDEFADENPAGFFLIEEHLLSALLTEVYEQGEDAMRAELSEAYRIGYEDGTDALAGTVQVTVTSVLRNTYVGNNILKGSVSL